MTKWLEDANGNRASVEYFGSEEKAQEALDSLVDCRACVNCSGCSRCSDCSDCSGKRHLRGTEGEHEVFEFTVPKIENIHSTIYAAASQPEALKMDTWHTCKNTHCRAGWAVSLAGEDGRALEQRFNTELAAMLIYRKSGAPINPARFYDKNDEALADMKRCAEAEQAA